MTTPQQFPDTPPLLDRALALGLYSREMTATPPTEPGTRPQAVIDRLEVDDLAGAGLSLWALRRDIATLTRHFIARALTAGWTWTQVADALAVSEEAARVLYRD